MKEAWAVSDIGLVLFPRVRESSGGMVGTVPHPMGWLDVTLRGSGVDKLDEDCWLLKVLYASPEVLRTAGKRGNASGDTTSGADVTSPRSSRTSIVPPVAMRPIAARNDVLPSSWIVVCVFSGGESEASTYAAPRCREKQGGETTMATGSSLPRKATPRSAKTHSADGGETATAQFPKPETTLDLGLRRDADEMGCHGSLDSGGEPRSRLDSPLPFRGNLTTETDELTAIDGY